MRYYKRKSKRKVVLEFLKSQKKNMRLLVMMGLFLVAIASGLRKEEADRKEESTFWERGKGMSGLEKNIWDTLFPLLAFVNQNKEVTESVVSLELFLSEFPIYTFLKDGFSFSLATEDERTYQMIIESEGRDENEIDEKGNLIASEGDVGVEQTLQDGMNAENEVAKQEEPEQGESIGGAFQKAVKKSYVYDLNQYQAFEELIKEFYVVDATTCTDAAQINLQTLLEKDMKLQVGNDKPQILIYHTHSQEGFADSVAGDESMTILGAGDRLTQILQEQYGYQVIHHRGKYDLDGRDYAYQNAAPEIEKILAENPSIEVVIDLHRDGVGEDTRLVSEWNGRKMAQFMFFNGLSKTKERGDITYLPNPYIADNLSLAFQLQLKCNEYYPGIARRIYLKGYRYNMHYKPKSLLIELGAQTNTVEEVMNALDPIADVLHMVLSGTEPELENQ